MTYPYVWHVQKMNVRELNFAPGREVHLVTCPIWATRGFLQRATPLEADIIILATPLQRQCGELLALLQKLNRLSHLEHQCASARTGGVHLPAKEAQFCVEAWKTLILQPCQPASEMG